MHSHHAAPAWEVFRVFLRLGLTSFGGPVAHLGYFRTEFVDKRRWITDGDYADLVTLSQFLPGPASSQVGFALGLRRAGLLGALAAFVAFTLPSAVAMALIAAGSSWVTGPIGEGITTGLTVVAVVVVAHAVWGMARTLTPDARRILIAVVAALLVIFIPGALGSFAQLIAIAFGLLAGALFCHQQGHPRSTASSPLAPLSRRVGFIALALFAVLLVGLPVLALITRNGSVQLFASFYHSGALVFGGGHVIVPLLNTALVEPGWITEQQFLTAYGAAQAMPGPLFTVAAHLGSVATVGPGGALGALLATIAMFLPGLLLITAALPFWASLMRHSSTRAMMRGANAAVVGLLAAALITPLATSTLTSLWPVLLALFLAYLLFVRKTPVWVIVLLGAVGGVLIEVTGGP